MCRSLPLCSLLLLLGGLRGQQTLPFQPSAAHVFLCLRSHEAIQTGLEMSARLPVAFHFFPQNAECSGTVEELACGLFTGLTKRVTVERAVPLAHDSAIACADWNLLAAFVAAMRLP